MKKIFVKTFGCTLNQKDSEEIIGCCDFFSDDAKINSADLILINTCGVKEQTETKIIKYLRDIKKLGVSDKKIIITGCLVTINDLGLKEICPNARYFRVDQKNELKRLFANKKENKIRNTETIIISNGCLGNCSYCAVKFARGKLNSKPISNIISEINSAIKNGAKEILLTSQDTGCYGQDINTNIVNLLKEVILIPGDFKVRLGMANPKYLLKYKKEIANILKSEKMYKFLHMPIQSGNDEILKKMNRPYTSKECENIVSYFKKELPKITLSTDVIVGFPTETKEQFNDTLKIIKKLKFDIVNISRFGLRKNIEANKYPDLPGRIKKDRSRIITDVCQKISNENNQKYLNKIKNVVIVDQNQKDAIGRTEEYKQVIIKNKKINFGQEIKVKITEIKTHYLIGTEITKKTETKTDFRKQKQTALKS